MATILPEKQSENPVGQALQEGKPSPIPKTGDKPSRKKGGRNSGKMFAQL